MAFVLGFVKVIQGTYSLLGRYLLVGLWVPCLVQVIKEDKQDSDACREIPFP